MAKFKSAISTIAALLMGTNAFDQTSLDNTCWVASDGGRPWPVQLTENGMAFHAQFVAPVAIWCLGVQRPRNLFDAMLSGSSFEGTYTACATSKQLVEQCGARKVYSTTFKATLSSDGDISMGSFLPTGGRSGSIAGIKPGTDIVTTVGPHLVFEFGGASSPGS
jgi:hypothetical protein